MSTSAFTYSADEGGRHFHRHKQAADTGVNWFLVIQDEAQQHKMII